MPEQATPQAETDGTENGSEAVAAAWRSLLRAPNRTLTFVVLVGSVLVVLLCWYFGAGVWFSVTFGAVLGGIGLLAIAVPVHRNAEWRDVISGVKQGARHDVLWLASSLRPRYGRVGHTAMRSVQELGQRRLALRHLELRDPKDGPEIERLIGTAAYEVLRSNQRRQPLLRSVVRCLDQLDQLDQFDRPDQSQPPHPSNPISAPLRRSST
ncbi:MAG: hypothetical protein JWN95_34 [Frankiales bacterium]|nr:hypothetical protein [Frankiales bacterium]